MMSLATCATRVNFNQVIYIFGENWRKDCEYKYALEVQKSVMGQAETSGLFKSAVNLEALAKTTPFHQI